MWRNLAAFLLSAVPGALLASVVVALWPKEGKGIFAHPLSMFVASCLLIYLLGIVFAGPALLLLRTARRHGLSTYVLTGIGALAGPALALLLWEAALGRITPYVFIYDLSYFAVAGLLAGATFWSIARPDRHARLKALRTIF